MYDSILVKKEGQLAYISINLPDVRNRLSKETVGEIINALEGLKSDAEVGCIVFTGEGDKAFAAGADIKQLNNREPLDVLKSGGMQEAYDYIEAYEKPTIAMINGLALGGGCELALASDIRVMADHAKIGLPELNLSIIPGAGGTQRLTRIVGRGKALEMILLGKFISAEEAKTCGLVSEVVPLADLKAKVEEMAAQILAKGPLAVRLAKIAVQLGADTDLKTGQMIERLAQAVLFATDDKKEGTAAFIEKRKPEFTAK
ncbi:enoyl-CoA hydratase/isomerase family protein [Cytobacillus purgationiresistens]|uniref:Enoyl-CoA hydratase n=1 Tax=Cytobacillus purgationiresistens TaxID=863449 RepID=A0ABU0AI67_9BACI|nr:enoyl-CoA hydratase-related protein [Cytobacillus purgationiresistens]MDQ0270411.1 enoyl-CoA hydratase [Cytobacillus purgationiresistens]